MIIEFAEVLLKDIRESKASRESLLLQGGIVDMEQYKSIVGELTGLSLTESKILDLLDKME